MKNLLYVIDRMKNLLYSPMATLSNEQPSLIAKAIFEKMIVREKARLQAYFFERLASVPVIDDLVLCGSVGLHGVYLHRRWSEDIDLMADPRAADGFAQMMDTAGLVLTRKGQRGKTTSYLLQAPSIVPNISLKVEVIARKNPNIMPERRTLVLSSGAAVTVWVKPLAEMLALKFGCINLRAKAMDFVDLWWGLNSAVELKNTVLEHILNHRCPAGEFTPTKLDSRLVRLKLNAMQETWQTQLTGYMTPVPGFEQVQQDFEKWIPFFAPMFRDIKRGGDQFPWMSKSALNSLIWSRKP